MGFNLIFVCHTTGGKSSVFVTCVLRHNLRHPQGDVDVHVASLLDNWRLLVFCHVHKSVGNLQLK